MKSALYRSNAVRVLTLGAAITLVAAGCGDDDTAADTTAVITVADVAPTEAGGAAATDAASAVSTDGASAPATDAAGQTGGSDVTADCQSARAALEAMSGSLDSIPQPEVGDSIPAQTADAAKDVVDALGGLDVDTDELQTAIDELKQAFEGIAAGGTFTQELFDEGVAAADALGTLCARSTN